MQKDAVKEMIRDIRVDMVKEKILHPNILKMPVDGEAAHTGTNNNWNHLMVAYLFNKEMK